MNPGTQESSVQAPQSLTWMDRLTTLLLALVCLEVGVCLLLFPWTDFWNRNYFSGVPLLRDLWPNRFFRGAVTGLGVVNILLAFIEASRLRRR